ncbi:hypothetical protein BJ508DRAFT_301903 [Ascobolus immersus RN42]|uniref:Uncharacterized protein n=1 Tax=Ascobolus immersus RN42 TaxID=1160509 RepID=A0A3N4IQP0_ASCIM|nr:hypothetical protein BJ508DRAFT_301903 [Ascobolus immersus RN42]
MLISPSSALLFLLLTQSSAHMYLSHPPPLRGLPSSPSTTLTQSTTSTLHLNGTAPHDGGSCQISLSMDKGKSWKVLKSMVGGCPRRKGKQEWTYRVPHDVTGTGVLAWSWVNRIGEFYMNCAKVEVVPAGGVGEGGEEGKVAKYRTTKRAEFVTVPPPGSVRRRGWNWRRHDGGDHSGGGGEEVGEDVPESPAAPKALPEMQRPPIKWEERPDMLILDMDIVDCKSPATKETDAVQYETEYPHPGDDVEYAEDGMYPLRLPTGRECVFRKGGGLKTGPGGSGGGSGGSGGGPGLQPNGSVGGQPSPDVLPLKPTPSKKGVVTKTKTLYTKATSTVSVTVSVYNPPVVPAVPEMGETVYVTSTSTVNAVMTATRTPAAVPVLPQSVVPSSVAAVPIPGGGAGGMKPCAQVPRKCKCKPKKAANTGGGGGGGSPSAMQMNAAGAGSGGLPMMPLVANVQGSGQGQGKGRMVTVTGVYTISVTVTTWAPLST